MSQCRKNSARSKMIDMNIRTGRLWDLQAGGQELSPQELSGLQVCNQRKSGEGERPPSFSFLSRHLAFIINNSSRLGSGIFSILCGQLDCHGTMEIFKVSVQWEGLYFEMPPCHKLLLFMCVESISCMHAQSLSRVWLWLHGLWPAKLLCPWNF